MKLFPPVGDCLTGYYRVIYEYLKDNLVFCLEKPFATAMILVSLQTLKRD